MTDRPVPTIDPRGAARAAEGDALLLDVREHDEWDAGHDPRALHIPLGELEARLGELPRDRPIFAVCRSGNRSGQATSLLLDRGLDAHNVEGGMQAWSEAGLPVIDQREQPGRIV